MKRAILLAVLAILISSAQGAERVGVTIDGWVVNPGAFTLTQGTTLKALIKEGTQNTQLHANGRLSKTGAKFILGHFASRVFLLRSGEHVIKPGITVKALNAGEEDYVIRNGDTVRFEPLCVW